MDQNLKQIQEELEALLADEHERGYQLAMQQRDRLSVRPLEPSAVYKPTPLPGPESKFDPTAQKLVGGGVFLAGVGAAGWGLSLAFTALAQATTGLGLLVALVGMLCYLRRGSSNGTASTPVNVSVNVRQQHYR